MKPVALIFDEGKFRYTRLERHGELAIYRQELKETRWKRYEVVRIRTAGEHVWPNGHITSEREVYPDSTTWDKDKWTFLTYDEAKTFLRTLI